MFDCCYAYELLARMEREELDRKVAKMVRYNLNPLPADSHRPRNPGRLSLFMVFFRNAIMK